ncbi:MAG: thiamine diphosphokinase [Alphaproteobacteria bacterium]|nr:thiamine diphosphokinase [Alphaproteobacteria bacterium]
MKSRKKNLEGYQSCIILDTSHPVLLVGGGWVDARVLVERAAISVIVALDGGADQLARLGYGPELIIGDLDSLEDARQWAARPVAVHHFSDQDSTDFDKALRSISAPSVVALGVLGDRLDHAVATLHSLSKHPMGVVTTLIGRADVVRYITAADVVLNLPIGSRVSVWTMQPVLFTASSGLQHPLDGLMLSPTGILGTSNISTAPRVSLHKPADQLGYYLMTAVEHAAALYAAEGSS